MSSNFYIQIGDLKGSADDHSHKDWIEVLSWNHGVSQTMTSSDRSAGNVTVERTNHQDWSFTKYIDKATCDLNLHCSQGTVFPKAVIEMLKSSGIDMKPVPYYKVTMTEVLLSSVSISGAEGGVPTENVSMNYGTIQWEYVEQKMDTGGGEGPIVKGWSIQENKSL